ncbi:MAG: PAS domain-containing sensor histidine kinase [Deltaproteobacteria bacterium]|nr:PAS domain-containing sensor histidine kinase [Deltaproteobacteria bacterium]
MKGAARGSAVWDALRAFAIALPPAGVAAWPGERRWPVLAVALLASALLAWWTRAAMRRRLQTVASVLAAYREGDFSIRARRLAGSDGPLADVLTEVNDLGDTLRQHRLGEIEAWALLRKVLSEIDVVVLAFDGERRIRLANEAAGRLLGAKISSITGCTAAEVGLADLLDGEAPRILRSTSFGAGPWELRRGAFRLAGEPHALVVLSDVSTALRENERDAWRRLIRVMGHEINNSLTPIRSMSEALLAELAKPPPRAPSFEEDLGEALGVIARRSDALGRFMASYARLAKLPPPRIERAELGPLVEKVALLERRAPVVVTPGPEVTIAADVDQLEQVLINLIKNAAEASLGAAPSAPSPVRVTWTSSERWVDVVIEDEGPGIADTTNLFVPFFTTKPDGSGIGLVLAREIVEAHKGELTLRPREGKGALARVRLPGGASASGISSSSASSPP